MNNTTEPRLNGSDGANMMFGPPPRQPDFTAFNWIWTIVPLIIIPVGTLGNLLVIIILLKPKNRKFPTALYLLALAVSDLAILWTGPFRMLLVARGHDDYRMETVAGCRISMFFTYSSIQFSSWMLVAVTMERVVGIVFPFRIKSVLNTRFVALLVISALLVCIFLLNIHYLIFLGDDFIEEIGMVLSCVPVGDSYEHFNLLVWPWVDFCVAFLVPFIILVTGNTVILKKVIESRGKRRKLSIISSHQLQSSEERIRSMTIMLILLLVVFFVSMTPASVFTIGFVYWSRQLPQDYNDYIDYIERLTLSSAIAYSLGYINATFNFYLYCLSGSRFRNDVKDLFRLRWLSSSTTESMFDVQRSSGSVSHSSTQSVGNFRKPSAGSLTTNLSVVSLEPSNESSFTADPAVAAPQTGEGAADAKVTAFETADST